MTMNYRNNSDSNSDEKESHLVSRVASKNKFFESELQGDTDQTSKIERCSKSDIWN
jgi:hypothetical protein